MLSGEWPDLVPDTIGYTSIICAFARLGMREGGDRAEELLRRSSRLYYGVGRKALRPDSITFYAVLLGLAQQAQMEYSKNISDGGAYEGYFKEVVQGISEYG